MEAWIQEAILQWKYEGLKLNPKTTINDILKAEVFLGYPFPEDFKELYLTVNGFTDYEWRNNLFSLWSLERIIAEYYDSHNGFIGFCDYSLCVFNLGFDKNKAGVYRHYPAFQEEENEFVSNSFQEVINLFNSDSKLLY